MPPPPLTVAGAHADPFQARACPDVGAVERTERPWIFVAFPPPWIGWSWATATAKAARKAARLAATKARAADGDRLMRRPLRYGLL